MTHTAVQLAELGALGPDLDTATAADVLWFYLGYTGRARLHEDSRWSHDRATTWSAEQVTRALLDPDRSTRDR